jgi:ABC-type uncharacterized transport system permease subunit
VAVAFHGGLFNIGGEGQAMMGGLGAALAALAWRRSLPAWLMLPLMVAGGDALRPGLGGGAGGAAGLARQPHRHHHDHVQLHRRGAAGLPAGGRAEGARQHGARDRAFGASARMPGLHELLAALGIDWPKTPLNLSVLLAMLAAVGVYLALWKSQPGYALRAVGFSPEAARYAGIAPRRRSCAR